MGVGIAHKARSKKLFFLNTVYTYVLYDLLGPTTEDNFFEWEAVVTGPENTPFQVPTKHYDFFANRLIILQQ